MKLKPTSCETCGGYCLACGRPGLVPSEVVLSTPPLTACFEKTEAECAAALLCFMLARSGDEWKPLPLTRMGEVLGLALNSGEEPVASWNRNPFMRPDFERLERSGYIERSEFADGTKCLGFTAKGIERLARWVPGAEAQKGSSRS